MVVGARYIEAQPADQERAASGKGAKMQKGRRWGECATRQWAVVGGEGEA